MKFGSEAFTTYSGLTDSKFDMESLKKVLDQIPKKKVEELWPETQDPFVKAFNNLTKGLPVYFTEYALEAPKFIPGLGVIARSKEDLEKFLEEINAKE